jgi:hypothetical protein
LKWYFSYFFSTTYLQAKYPINGGGGENNDSDVYDVEDDDDLDNGDYDN